MDMPLIFMVLMGVSVLAYVVLDGYDLGVGMLMPAATNEEQSVMVSSIGPFWDANETWLVLGVGILLIAFPAASGIVLGALYLPVVAMLVGLMLRGVAFEFRMKALGWHRDLWNWLFWAGSFLASFCQGVMLGSYITGFERSFFNYMFNVVVGASVCGGYVLLGSTWLIGKTEGDLQKKAVLWARWGLLWVALGVALVSIATPLISATVRGKWFDFPSTLALMLLPAASLAAWIWVWRGVGRFRKGHAVHDWQPFAGVVAIFSISFLGLAYSLFPYVVIDRLTIWEAAAHPSALKVTLIGALIVLPFIVGYTIVAYRVFGGKAKAGLYD
ncbi:Cytochrome bd-I ubiquinol oxidase subunit 2 [Usitatibacter rugosus]|uniref:Cytochrome bd-I ubiquinol oxidase subunit 2 n=1 Tax=Usitatibacter rugosus TaxID=2732067 RepID=A0A6M4GR87_9PROT|nr:cytochrome d ubiquinol oxidase subunit II [Usitatibacter rugosus]QJR09761.1 Cytochrome bd-I ubiquinol oxidase subunit 2 [Usitatibacter rugosus]